MSSSIYNLIFSITSLWILLKTIGFAIYEIKTMNNKMGGTVTILFSICVVIFFNIMLWLH